MARLLTRMVRTLTRMTRWLAYYTHSTETAGKKKTHTDGLCFIHELSQQSNSISNAVSINSTIQAIQQNFVTKRRH